MKVSRISLCYYPSTVVLIDDDKQFLDVFQFNLSAYLPFKRYELPEQALRFFWETYRPLDSFIARCLVNPEEENESDLLVQELNIRRLHQEIENPNRFQEISVMVVDYTMPSLNGLDLSRKIREKYPFIQIIMLTGEAEQSLAIEAFNEGIIDQFIMKNNADVFEKLLPAIHEAQKNYFIQLSELCFSRFFKQNRFLSCLSDPVFIKMFQEICKKNEIVEYYLMDEQGSFLMLNVKGQHSWLAVKTEEEMDSFYHHAVLEETSQNLISALKDRKFLLYFHTDEDFQTPPEQWGRYLQPATLLVGEETYYYSYITDPKAYQIDTNKILPYQKYLERLQ